MSTLTLTKSIAKTLTFPIRSLLTLLYPELCCSCQITEPLDEHIFCLDCLLEIPFSDMHLLAENDLTRHFWGRVDIEFGAAMFMLDRKNRVKDMIHEIKYRNQRYIAEELGRWYGKKLGALEVFKTIDYIIPVPLHPSKLQQRGFNQSDYWAMGLSQSLDIDLKKNYLRRLKKTKTQTRMDRSERIVNMQDAFQLSKKKISTSHILLVDDVMTTGSTLEACALVLKEAGHTVSIATIAVGQM